MKLLRTLLILFIMQFYFLACSKTGTQNKHNDIADNSRALDNCLYYTTDTFDSNNNRLLINCYFPLIEPGYRSFDSFPIVTFEFNDTALCATVGLLDCPSKIIENTADSFILISYNFPNYQYRKTCEDHKKLQQFIDEAKSTLPSAKFDSSGVIDTLRKADWVAKFKKSYRQNGLILRTDGFSFTVIFPELEQKQRSKKELAEIAERRLPPFLIYSLPDYIKYFAPPYDHWDEYILRYQTFGVWGPRPVLDEITLSYYEAYSNYK